MKKKIAILCAAAILALPALAPANEAPSPDSHNPEGKVIAGNAVVQRAEVKAIDLQKRQITLLMPDGTQQTFYVDPAVQRLGEVQAGDTIRMTYVEAVSVKLNKVRVPSGVRVEQTLVRDEQAPTPTGAQGVAVTSTATIEKILDNGGRVRLRMPDGTTNDVQVRSPENRAKLQRGEVKEGDQIEITYRSAKAVTVEKQAP